MNLTRRSFLGASAVAAASPWFWVKKSFAQSTPGFGSAKHVLILYAGGGLRSAPLFNADADFQHNPFGKMNASSEWAVGSVLGAERRQLFTFPDETLPTVADIANEIAVVAGVDHEPGTSEASIDHGTGDLGVTTGLMDGDDAGLLTRIHRDLPGYRNGTVHLPPIDIGLSNFGRGERDFAGDRPIAIQSAADFRGRSDGTGRDTPIWARDLRLARDAKFIGARAPHVRPYLSAIRDAKINAREYAEALRSSALDLVDVPDAELGGATNQQLLEVLGGGPFGGGQWGLEVAFALRMMQLGVPAVSVMRYLYDTHSEEKTTLPIDAGDLGRQIAGLHFLLKRMRDDTGATLWDNTVVVLMSEFARDNTDPNTGFNTGNGSDHQGAPASRNQCWPIFGGPITAKGRRLGRLDPKTLDLVEGRGTSIRSMHATVLGLLGIDASRHFSDPPVAALTA
jgi:hypothetical protein